MEPVRVQHTWYNLMIVTVLCLGSLTYGYAFSVISTTLGQPGFYNAFNLAAGPTEPGYAYTAQILGAMNGLLSFGALLGCWTVGWISDILGRKKALAIAAAVALVGCALAAGSTGNIAMFLVARWLTGWGIGNLVTLVPLMQAELSPPSTRGFLVAQNGIWILIGYVLAGWIGYACTFATNTSFQWRLPLAIGALWPLNLLVLVYWIPESPRWLLLAKNDLKTAESILKRLHVGSNNTNGRAARDDELMQIYAQVEADRKLYVSESTWALFTRPSYRKRMLCGFFAFFANEACGILVIANYSVIIYKGLGLKGSEPVLLTAAYYTVGLLANLVGSLLVDRWGRKPLIVIGPAGTLVALVAETALVARYAGTENRGGLAAAVFFLFVHVFFYGSCVDGNSFVFCAEIFPNHLRSKGMAWSVGSIFLSIIPFLVPAPTAFNNIGWKYYLVFIVLTAVNIPIIYFLFPETKGIPLEEIAEIFGDEVVKTLGNGSGRCSTDDEGIVTVSSETAGKVAVDYY